MAQIILEIPDVNIVAVRNHVALALGYQDNVAGPNNTTIPNPETKAAFIKRHLAQYLKALAVKGARMAAEKTAGDAAQASIDPIAIT